MSEDKDTMSTLLLGVGIAIGAFIIWIAYSINKDKNNNSVCYNPYQQYQQSPYLQTMQYQQPQLTQPTQSNAELNTKISNIEEANQLKLSAIENMLNYLKNQQTQQPLTQPLVTELNTKISNIENYIKNQLPLTQQPIAHDLYDINNLKTPKKPINSISNMKSKEETERIRQMFGML